MVDTDEAVLPEVVGAMLHLRGKIDVIRNHRLVIPLHLRHHGPNLRPSPGWLVVVAPPRHALEGGVLAGRADQRVHEDELVGHGRQPRKMLADTDSRHLGRNRRKLPAHTGRSIHLDIIHVLVRRTARQVDHDDGLVGASRFGHAFRPQELREAQPAQAKRANLDEVPPRHLVAVAAVFLTENV